MGYRLDGPGLILAVQDFSLLHSIQTSSVAHSGSYSDGIRGSFLGVKWQEHEVDNSPPSRADVKNDRAIIPLTHVSMV
jgi:hypothetical protein